MQNGTDHSRRPSTAIRLEDLRLSAEQMDAVRQGFTIALTNEHLERRGAQPLAVEGRARDPRGLL